MPNVLVLGANGYVGSSISQALARSGNHAVWGLVRSAEKGTHLALNEITPVVGDASKPESFTSLIESVPIDVVIDSSNAYEHAGAILKAISTASKSRLEKLAQESRSAAPKLGYIMCSGLWVHGSSASDTPVNDLEMIGSSLSKGKPGPASGWRAGMEQAVLSSRDVLDVAIIRPAMLYGRSSYIWGAWWGTIYGAAAKAKVGGAGSQAHSDAVMVPASKDARPAITHVDDVAAGFALAVDKIHGLLGDWPVFDLIGETVNIVDVIEGARVAFELQAPVELTGTGGDPFMEAMSTRCNVESSRARTILGWEPKRRDFVLRLPVYAKAFAAGQQLGTK